jgi:hypothetical protein
VTTLEHLPFSPDPAPADVYLFSRRNSALKRRLFCDVTDFKNEKEELKRLSQNGFQDVSTYCRWQKLNFAQEDCFEGNLS